MIVIEVYQNSLEQINTWKLFKGIQPLINVEKVFRCQM